MTTGRAEGTAVDRPDGGGPYLPKLLPDVPSNLPAAPCRPVNPGTPTQLPPAQQGPVPSEFCLFSTLLFFGHGILAGAGPKSAAGPKKGPGLKSAAGPKSRAGPKKAAGPKPTAKETPTENFRRPAEDAPGGDPPVAPTSFSGVPRGDLHDAGDVSGHLSRTRATPRKRLSRSCKATAAK